MLFLACGIGQDQHPRVSRTKFGDFKEFLIPRRHRFQIGVKERRPFNPLLLLSVVGITVVQMEMSIIVLILVVAMVDGFGNPIVKMNSVLAMDLVMAGVVEEEIGVE